LPEERGCNRPPVLGTASLYGWRTIKGLRHILRDGTAWGKVFFLQGYQFKWSFEEALADRFEDKDRQGLK